ncbi:hypothetical protein [Pseudogemmobacter humi]|uniref:hypothetical protein n=1 Tax=Pseudogemmobacter humi TaxID=2483812 RepID=UPI001358459F|nr:hypothetical protein [Pseudogemmobacter humi]
MGARRRQEAAARQEEGRIATVHQHDEAGEAAPSRSGTPGDDVIDALAHAETGLPITLRVGQLSPRTQSGAPLLLSALIPMTVVLLFPRPFYDNVGIFLVIIGSRWRR